MATKKLKKGLPRIMPPIDTPEAEKPAQVPDSFEMLDPAQLLIGPNVRFKISKLQIEQMKAQILEAGKIHTSIQARELTAEEREKNPEQTHLVIAGNIRTTAAKELNEESQAGIMVPTLVTQLYTVQDRIKRQVSENMDRQSMSLMDIATAIDQAKEAGITNVEICKMFPRATGKTKLQVEPASNAWVNMVWRFLEFDKKIQDRIADGRIPILAAYELYRKPKEKWNEIVDAIEASRVAQIQRDENEEIKFLGAIAKTEAEQAKEQERTQKEQEAKDKLAAVQEELRLKEEALLKVKEEEAAAFKAQASAIKLPKENRIKLDEEFKKKQAEAKAAADELDKTQKALDKAKATAEGAAKLAEERRLKSIENLAKARERAAAVRLGAPVSATEVHQAAVTTGASASTGLRSRKELVDGIDSIVILSIPSTKYPKTIALGHLLKSFASGKISDGQLHQGIAKMFEEEPGSKVIGPAKTAGAAARV